MYYLSRLIRLDGQWLIIMTTWNGYLEYMNKDLEILHHTYDALRELVPFVQLKKREKHPWRSININPLVPSLNETNKLFSQNFAIPKKCYEALFRHIETSTETSQYHIETTQFTVQKVST